VLRSPALKPLNGLGGYAGDMRGLVVEAIIICPLCAYEALEAMPTDACQHVYPCQGCGELLRPREGDCCVFCSYGDSCCPPKQLEAA
jgi:hypothetical protein